MTLLFGQQHEDLMNDLMNFVCSTIDSGAPVHMQRPTFDTNLAAGAKLEFAPEGIVGVLSGPDLGLRRGGGWATW